MAKARRDDLTWQDVDTDKFKGAMLKAYKDFKAASLAARQAREAFETAFRKEAEKKLDGNTSVLIAHRFGKMAIAQVYKSDLDTPKAKTEKFTL